MQSASLRNAIAICSAILFVSSARADILIYGDSVEGWFTSFSGAEVTASTGPSFDQLGAFYGVQGVKGYGSADFLFTENSDHAVAEFQFGGTGEGMVTNPTFGVNVDFAMSLVADPYLNQTYTYDIVVYLFFASPGGGSDGTAGSFGSMTVPGINESVAFDVDLDRFLGQRFLSFDARLTIYPQFVAVGDTLNLTIPQNSFDVGSPRVPSIPEPGSLAMMCIGLAGLISMRHRRV